MAISDGQGNAEVKEFPVPEISADKCVDFNGAGDAFVGGFLAQLHNYKDLETCIKAGIALSQEVVQLSGCTFPDKMNIV